MFFPLNRRNDDSAAWSGMTYAEKNRALYQRQRMTLKLFLERGAISQAQHDQSLRDLTLKMGMTG